LVHFCCGFNQIQVPAPWGGKSLWVDGNGVSCCFLRVIIIVITIIIIIIIYIYIHNHFVSFWRRSVAYKYGFPECLWLKGFSLKSTYSMFPSCLMLQPARHLTSSKTTDPRFR
jgi:hypothetical protein